jgi:hypothetical protein
MFANKLNQTNSKTGKSDIELSKVNSTVTPMEDTQEQIEDLEQINILPNSFSSNAINAPINIPLESEQHRSCNIKDQ